jgi:Mn2+/Fe2+ NRAMP family transporter
MSRRAFGETLKQRGLDRETRRSASARMAPLGVAAAFGPGLLVMLADTDVSSVVTAAQSGAQWGYRLLALQFLLIPALYVAQELAARLGVGTGRGCARLIAETYGAPPAWLSVAALGVSCFAALVTQIAGLADVGLLFGLPRGATTAAAVAFILAMVWTRSYQSVERVAIGLGLFELAFLVVAWRSAPDSGQMLAEMTAPPLANPSFLTLVAANIGACVMPWTLFYQQSAVVDKRLEARDLGRMRLDTLGGAVLCQVITAAILIAAAATLRHPETEGIGGIARALTNSLGPLVGKTVFALGLSGSAMVATIVICLALAWTIGEMLGASAARPSEMPGFAPAFSCALALGGLVVAFYPDSIRLAIGAALINAVLLPLILLFLFGLARRRLVGALRMGSLESTIVGGLFLLAGGLSLACGVAGFLA